MDERSMIAAARRGDAPSFNHLVRAYQRRVYNIAYRILGDADAAADATQAAFIAAFNQMRGFRGGSFHVWLLRIVTNACYDQLRLRQFKPMASLDAPERGSTKPATRLEVSSQSPQDYAERREIADLIQQGLGFLPIEQRVTVVLSDVEGLAYAEIAAITATNVGTVKLRLSRGRAYLRAFLVDQGAFGDAARRPDSAYATPTH